MCLRTETLASKAFLIAWYAFLAEALTGKSPIHSLLRSRARELVSNIHLKTAIKPYFGSFDQ